ncbi:MAG: 2-hydroxyacyl-CoA dehydratase [Clostridiales bacterium]|jgi:benzoyl-CoA reductase subunit B|nr:2-hydroxyacyl-CoA dehydratase [Clostridiales bacterium]
MADVKNLEELVLKGEMTIVEFACTKIDGSIERMKERNPEMLWTMEIQKFMWDGYRDAHKNGKKLVFYGGSVPTEIIAAFDCVGFYMDTIPFRLSTNPALTAKYIDEAEKYVAPSMCGLDKTELGAWLCGAYGIKPDIFVYNSVPCDSSRIAYPALEKIIGVPTFSFDTPFRRDERGAEYLADQIEDFIAFMEEHTGNKLDWDKLKYYMENANRNFELQRKCADLRKHKPCPLPGRLLVLNGTTNAAACYPIMGDLYESELEVGQMMIDLGMGACPDEKYRIAMLQNMIWGNAGIMDWMQKEYNAVAVMDAFGFQGDIIYEHMDDRRDCLKVMGKKIQNNPMIHGASGPSEHHIKMVDEIFEQYDANVSMFLGHVGCKHTWASAKMVSDMVQEKYGLPTLFIDLDAIDGRYKSSDEIKAQIKEYFETVVMQ